MTTWARLLLRFLTEDPSLITPVDLTGKLDECRDGLGKTL
jgi:hypothetical protein